MAASNSRQSRIVMLFMAAVLLFGAVTAVTQPGGEFPPYAYALFNIALDAVMTVLLAILTIAEVRTPSGGLKPVAILAGVVGVVAGVVQSGIRLTSDHAWWTGHYMPPVFN